MTRWIRTHAVTFLTLGLLVFSGGCSSLSQTEQGAIIGAASGAVVGGAVGNQAGSTTRGVIVGAAVGGAAGALIGSRMDDKAETLDERLPNATVERVGEGILVTFDGGLLFDFDSDRLRPAARERLAELARSLDDMPDVEVLVAGHTDSVGDEDYNYDLSLRRARAATDRLAEVGMERGRLRMVGLGEEEPVATNETEAGRQQNRRVEVAIYASEEMQRRARERAGA